MTVTVTQTPSLEEELRGLVVERRFEALRQRLKEFGHVELGELLAVLPDDIQVVAFRMLPREKALDTFEYLPLPGQEALLKHLGDREAAQILNDISPDDRTALLEELPGKVTKRLLNLLSASERSVAVRLLGYPEYSIGRLMTPDYVAVKPHWTVAQALEHVRRYGRDSETLNVVYVTGPGGVLVDDIRMRELLLVDPHTKVESLLDDRFVSLHAADDQEAAVAEFRKHDRTALPVTDSRGVLVGIVTVDDVLDVAEDEATEDIQKLGAVEALEQPYLDVSLAQMLRKRAVWLVVLFLGQMLTTSAMGAFAGEIAGAVVLALFIPLIISSGGNSGSQAAALVTRAIALGEITLADWWRVTKREVLTGAGLGGILAVLGFVRVAIWGLAFDAYGPHWLLIGVTVALALFGVVLWGSLAGTLLPIVLKRFGADPAASSAPFVATVADVTGVLIFFGLALLILRGTLL